MKSIGTKLTLTLGFLGAAALLGQTPAPAPAPAAPQQGPGIQAANDARYPDWIAKNCKVPPAGRGGGGGAARGAAPGGAAPAARGGADAARGAARGNPNEPPVKRDYAVKEIPGVIAAGQKWKTIWTGTGNNADGIIASKSGGILAAQNTNSDVMELDKKAALSFPYKDTNTGGAVSMNKKGALFIVERGLPAAIWELAPKRHLVANMMNGEPLDCIGGVINDLSAASDGGIYFTMGGLFYVNPQGVVTKQGTIGGTNGIILSPDEKRLYVTGRIGTTPAGGAGSLIAYDVKPDGSLGNERQFAMAGGDGSTVDAAGRVYTTGGAGLFVVGPDGKLLGEIPSPLPLITVAFSGKDKKTLYGVANTQRFDEIFTIQMISQGYKGRAK